MRNRRPFPSLPARPSTAGPNTAGRSRPRDRATAALAAAALVTLAGCGAESAAPAADTRTPASAPHFDYDADSAHGPDHWGDTEGWERCATGAQQSPIDVPAGKATPLADQVTLDWTSGTLSALNNAHTVNLRPDGENLLTHAGRSYRLAQMHLHADSEHEIDGTAAPLEAHFVHGLVDDQGDFVMTKDADTSQEVFADHLVIGVMLAEGAENPAWGRVLDPGVLPATPGQEYRLVSDAQFDPTTLLPAERDAFAYTGSLTTPTPTCVEGVRWFVLTTAVEVSEEQVAAFTALYDNNSRPVQPRA